ncbi:MAG: glycosyltransferase family 9 protein [Acetobacteraceae bacterium]|nr:glycosyltransferase family 9 protein [Acetobacteraceae bacterium]MBV8521953.1 glycosyltransferase family 9 protein [Acetobacteraceae bacterium]
MRILFISSNRIGDAVLSTGLLDHLIRTHPEASITVACGPAAEGVFARMPNRAETILLDKRPFDLHWAPFWWHAARRRWDLVVDIRGSALSWLVPTRRRAVMRPGPGHKTAQLAAVLRLSPPPVPVAWTGPEDRALAAELLPSGPTVALGPTANWSGKIWPAQHFVALFRALENGFLPGATPVILAGPGEQERSLAAPVADALPAAIDLTGRLSLPQVAACLARVSLYIGNDSGLMHLAAAAGAPTLGLFGPTRAAEYAPAGPRAAAVTASGPRMEDLSVVDALSAAVWLLNRDALVDGRGCYKGF